MATIPINIPLIPAQEGMHNDGRASGNENELWSMAQEFLEEEQEQIVDALAEGVDVILAFDILFAATVAAFILHFSEKLSTNQTDPVLLPDGTYSTTAHQLSPHSTAVIDCAITMWIISFGLSLTSALFAMLLQGWARLHNELPLVPSDPHDRALVRWSLLKGTERYGMRHISWICFLLPHIFVYLFLGGLVLILLTIDMTVAIVVDVAVGVFVLAFITRLYRSSCHIHASP